MNDRERWRRTMRFEKVDHVPDEEFGYWSENFEIWHAQGLPECVNSNEDADRYFGFSRKDIAPVHVGLLPGFKPKTILEDETRKVIVNAEGVKCEVNKDDTSSIPRYLEFPLKDRKDFKEFKKRLDPKLPLRYPHNWEELKKGWIDRDFPLGIPVGSLFGRLRNWMGFENIAIATHDDPGLIDDMIEYMCDFIMGTVRKAVREVDFDFAAFWEDMAFNNGPMISPAMFEKFLVPRYKRITGLLKKHGVDVVYLDCDGNINELVPLWLEAGVNCMFPIEVRAGTRPEVLREKYGKKVLLAGGVDKMALLKGRDKIKKEVRKVAGLAKEGGYIPHVDHRVPPDVKYSDYLYYLDVKRDLLGIPKKRPWGA